MYSISGLARHADLPRRTVQFWVDKEVLEPVDRLAISDAPRVFSIRELEVAKMLRPFVLMASPIGIIHLLARVFRDILELEAAEKPAATHVKEALAAARAGDIAYLVVYIFTKARVEVFDIAPDAQRGLTGEHMAQALIATSDAELVSILAREMAGRPYFPYTIINLQAALASWAPKLEGTPAD
jgi:hypothetical protein